MSLLPSSLPTYGKRDDSYTYANAAYFIISEINTRCLRSRIIVCSPRKTMLKSPPNSLIKVLHFTANLYSGLWGRVTLTCSL